MNAKEAKKIRQMYRRDYEAKVAELDTNIKLRAEAAAEMVSTEAMVLAAKSVFEYLISESMPKGGRRPGAGRPKGSLAQATIERMAAEEASKARVVRTVDRLFNSQLAFGSVIWFLTNLPIN
jgi:hypothetical protein